MPTKCRTLEEFKTQFSWIEPLLQDFLQKNISCSDLNNIINVQFPKVAYSLEHLTFDRVYQLYEETILFKNHISDHYLLETMETYQFEEEYHLYTCAIGDKHSYLECDLNSLFYLMSNKDENKHTTALIWCENTDIIYDNLENLKRDTMILKLSGV